MNAPGDLNALHQQALDWLFARLGGSGPVPPSGTDMQREEESDLDDTPVDAEPSHPPEVRSANDLKIASDWIRRERARLEAYTRAQLARVQQEHQALVGQNYLNEQNLILRSQELSRKEEVLLAQGRAVQQQAEELNQREQTLAGQLQEWWQASAQLASLQEETSAARQDADHHRALAHTLQSETQAMQLAREKARQEFESLLRATEDLRETRLEEEAGLRARQQQLEERTLAAERAALAFEQRQAELEDVEVRLRREVEEQEQDLRQQRQTLEAQIAALRTQQTAIQAQQALLDQKLDAALQAEQAVSQRQSELDEMHERLEQLYQELEQQLEDPERLLPLAVVESATLEVHEEENVGQTPPWPQQTARESKLPERTYGSHPGTTRFERWLHEGSVRRP